MKDINLMRVHPEVRDYVVQRYCIELENHCRNYNVKTSDINLEQKAALLKMSYLWVLRVCLHLKQNFYRKYFIGGLK